jgi:hypothetical protein
MKAESIHIRINRLVVDAALAEGVGRGEFDVALKAAVTLVLGGKAEPASPFGRTAPSSAASPVAGAVAEGIASRLAGTTTGPEASRTGGRHG